MRIVNTKKILNLLLVIFLGILIVTQILVLRRERLADSQAAMSVPAGRTIQIPDSAGLLQALPDSFYSPGNSRMVVLRLMYNECKDCRDSVFEGAKRLASRIGDRHICIIAGNYEKDQFLMYRRLYSYHFRNFIQIPERLTMLDTASVSYYFLANRNFPGKADMVFIPGQTNYGLTQWYFNRLDFLFN